MPTDTERFDWLERNPRACAIRLADCSWRVTPIDSHAKVFTASTLRGAIDLALLAAEVEGAGMRCQNCGQTLGDHYHEPAKRGSGKSPHVWCYRFERGIDNDYAWMTFVPVATDSPPLAPVPAVDPSRSTPDAVAVASAHSPKGRE